MTRILTSTGWATITEEKAPLTEAQTMLVEKYDLEENLLPEFEVWLQDQTKSIDEKVEAYRIELQDTLYDNWKVAADKMVKDISTDG